MIRNMSTKELIAELIRLEGQSSHDAVRKSQFLQKRYYEAKYEIRRELAIRKARIEKRDVWQNLSTKQLVSFFA